MQCVGGCWAGRVEKLARRQVGVGPGEQVVGWTTSLWAVGSKMWVAQLSCEDINTVGTRNGMQRGSLLWTGWQLLPLACVVSCLASLGRKVHCLSGLAAQAFDSKDALLFQRLACRQHLLVRVPAEG